MVKDWLCHLHLFEYEYRYTEYEYEEILCMPSLCTNDPAQLQRGRWSYGSRKRIIPCRRQQRSACSFHLLETI